MPAADPAWDAASPEAFDPACWESFALSEFSFAALLAFAEARPEEEDAELCSLPFDAASAAFPCALVPAELAEADEDSAPEAACDDCEPWLLDSWPLFMSACPFEFSFFDEEPDDFALLACALADDAAPAFAVLDIFAV